MEQPRTIAVNLELGIVTVKNVRTKPYIGWTDDGKPITGEQITHDMVFHLDNAIHTAGMDDVTKKLIVDGLRNETKQLVITGQSLSRPSGPEAFATTPEYNIRDLRNGTGPKSGPLPRALKAVSQMESLDDLNKLKSVLVERIKSVKS